MSLKRCFAVLVAALGLGLVPAGGVAAQATDDLARVRQAAAAEAAGDLAGAERLLLQALAEAPTSLPALLSLERVLLLQRRVELLLPAIDRLLALEPGATAAHQMRLRTHAVLDRPGDVERAARAWIDASPRTEAPYREIARVWRTRADHRRAIAVLESGRGRIGRPDALALEIGDAWLDAGDPRRAVAEWSRAVGPAGQGLVLVQRRLSQMDGAGAAHVEPLLIALNTEPTTSVRRRAAVQVAVEAGLPDRALQLARSLLPGLAPAERRTFLSEVARRADGAGAAALAHWAYGSLIEVGGMPREQLLVLRTRRAELAVELGETNEAAALYGEIEATLRPGSPERRAAIATRIELTTRSGDVGRAAEEFAAFRREYPAAGEQGDLAAALAAALLERGDLDGAEAVLVDVPGTTAALARGRVFLRRGDLVRARGALLTSAQALRGGEATQTIALVALIGRLGAEANEVLATALALSEGGDRASAVAHLVVASTGLDPAERAALLGFGASHAAAAALHDHADQAWTELLEVHSDAREAPAALLGLARSRARRGDAADALPLLERLLVEHPLSALVPQARQELDRLLQPAARR